MNPARIGVTLVGHRTPADLLVRAVQALAAQTARPTAVLVHFNASTAAEAHDVERQLLAAADGMAVRTTWSEDNHGFSSAHNRLLSTALAGGCEIVVVHNPDLALAPDALQHLADAVLLHGSRALYGPLLELADPVTLAAEGRIDTAGIRWTWDGRHLDDRQGEPCPVEKWEVQQVAGISGACLVVPAAVYRRVHEATGEFFDEDFFAYREDAELAYRCALIGIPSRLVPAARGAHVRGLRGTSRHNTALNRLGVRNRFLLAAKYGRRRPGGLVGPLLRDLVVCIAVLTVERSSISGLVDAARLRRHMAAKGRVVMALADERLGRTDLSGARG